MKTLVYFMAVLCIFSMIVVGSAAHVEIDENTGIMSAFNSVEPGDTVHISEGTYSIDSSIFVPAGVEVYGDGAGKTIIYTDSDKDCSSASNPALFVVQKNDVVIHDLTFKGPAVSLQDQHKRGGTSSIGGYREARNGMMITASNVTVYNCSFTRLLCDGIRITGSSKVAISNCIFDCAGHDSISVYKSKNVKTNNCKFNLMINACVRFYNVEKCSLTNSTFTQSMSGTGAGYVEFEGTIKDIAINHNVFLNSSDPVLFAANPGRGDATINANILYGVKNIPVSFSAYDVVLRDNNVYTAPQNWTEMGYGYNGGTYAQMTPYVDDGINQIENESENISKVVEENITNVELDATVPENCTENCTAMNETTVVEENVSSISVQFFDELTAKYFDFSSEQAETASVLVNESASDLQQAKMLMNNTTTEERQLGQKYLEVSELKLQYAQDMLNLSHEGLNGAKNRMNVSCENKEC